MTLALAAVAVMAVGLIVSLAVRLRRAHEVARQQAELEPIERRGEQREFMRMLEELQTMDARYARFTRQALSGFAVIAVAVIASLSIGGVTLGRTHELTVQQAQGRGIAIDALCASTSAVIDAGRQTIVGATGGSLPTKFERALERLGFPPRKVQHAQAEVAARAYGQSIAHRVEVATHVKGIAKPDGSLDCKRLRHAAHAFSPSGR